MSAFEFGKLLTASDYDLLQGIDRQIIERAGLRRVDSLEGGQIVGRNGHGDYSGIIFPYRWPGDNHAREYRLRRDHPEMEAAANGRLKPKDKYLSPPGRGNMFYFPPDINPESLADPKIPMAITEGERKALALWCLALHDLSDAADAPRWIPIGIAGVWNWTGVIGKAYDAKGVRVDEKGIIPDFKRIVWKGRLVKIVFDSNVYSNEKVEWARKGLAKALRDLGAIVEFVDIPEIAGVNGVDDLVVVWGKQRVIELINTGGSATGNPPWKEPLALTPALPPVEKFSMDLLPPVFRRMVEDAAERMQVPADLLATPLLVASSAVVGRRARIQPKAIDSQWQVTPNLWGAVIAPPGFLKTPSQRLGTAPLKKVQDLARTGYAAEEERYKRELENYNVKVSAWHSNAVKEAKSNKYFADFREDKPVKPKSARYIVNDATESKLQEILAENPGGVLFERDELSGWLSQLDQTGREGERAFMLEAWEGNGSHHVDRISRGTTFCDSLCVSVIGGIQPSKFRSYASSMLQDGTGKGGTSQNDGLLQRLQLLIWPDMDPVWTYVDRQPNYPAIEQVTAIFEQISKLSPDTPVQMRFDDEAQSLFVEWLSALERKELRKTDQHEAFVSHLSKYRSLIPSLAGLFQLVEIAAGEESLSSGQDVSIRSDSLNRAIRWGSYLRSHAERIYSCLISPEMHAAQNLSQKIKAGKLGQDKFHVRSVYQKGWSGLNTPNAARAALAILEDAYWVRTVRQEAQPWRPAEEYEINPKVFTEDF